MDLSLYNAEIAAVEGSAGRSHTSPRLLISLWLYAYGRGISSARELSRQCDFEPGSLWLCGCQPISYRTLSGFRSDYQVALDNLFVQVLGMLSAEGLITMERVTLDGTKIKANASGNTFRRKARMMTEEANQIYNSDRRLRNFHTPGLSSVAGFDSSDAVADGRHRWKRHGRVSVTTSHAGFPYDASSMLPQQLRNEAIAPSAPGSRLTNSLYKRSIAKKLR